MIEMRPPSVLDGDRPVTDHRDTMETHAENERDRLRTALKESCDYALELWHELNRMRAYLLESAPQPRRPDGEPRRFAATPAGIDDEDGWAKWESAFESLTRALCGPSGDSGFSAQDAAREVRERRLPDPPPVPPAAVIVVPADESAERRESAASGGRPDTAPASSPASRPDSQGTDDRRPKRSHIQFVAGAVLGLSVRTVLRRRHRRR